MKLGTCKICKGKFEKRTPLHSLCSGKCAIEHMKRADEKAKATALAKSKRETKAKLKTRSDWLKEAQVVFNAYIRLRDEHLPCISCGRHHQGQYHAGHYRTVGSAPHLRFDEENVHKQCAPCNNHLSGNIVQYRLRLLERVGGTVVDRLESDNTPKHYTMGEIIEIKSIYKEKLKQLKKGNSNE